MNTKAISKKLSYVLRHKPEDVGLKLDDGGWVDVPSLLLALRICRQTLDKVIAENNKQRFAYNADGTKIRASQGHSIQVNLSLEPRKPPAILYHGTAEKTVEIIAANGIRSMSRNHVHLSDNRDTARDVGARHGKPVVLEVAALLMYEEGHDFYLSDNGVWLTDFVSSRYVSLNQAPLNPPQETN